MEKTVKDFETYAADDLAAATALANEIAGAVPRLAIVASAILHVVPVPGAGAVPQCLVSVDRDMFIGAAKGGCHEGIAVLEEAVMDQEAGAGEGVEGVEVDGGDDRVDDAGQH